jgi:hypothetical protein
VTGVMSSTQRASLIVRVVQSAGSSSTSNVRLPRVQTERHSILGALRPRLMVWAGSTDAPLMLRSESTTEVYALTLKEK